MGRTFVEVLKANKGKVIAFTTGIIAVAGGAIATVLIGKRKGVRQREDGCFETDYEDTTPDETSEENCND